MPPNVVSFPQSRPGVWFRAVWPLAAGLLLLTIVMSPGRVLSWDSAIRLSISRALWTEGTVFVDAAHPNAKGMVEVGGKYTSFYGIGQSLLFVPFDMVGAALSHIIAPESERARVLIEWSPLLFLYMPLVALALWASIAWFLHEFGVRGGASAWSAALYCVTTIAFAYSAQSLQEETLIATLIATAAAGVLHAGRTGVRWSSILAGFCAGFSLLCRLNSLFALIPLAVLLFEHPTVKLTPRLERLKYFAYGAIGPIALHFVFAYWRFGNVFGTGYDLLAANGSGNGFGEVRPMIAIGLLFGFGKGVFLLSPPLLLSVFGWKELSKTKPNLWIAVAAIIVVSAFFHSSLLINPDGSECWGVRYLVHAMVWLAFPMRVGIQHLATQGWGRALATCALVAGFWIQLAACFVPDSVEYIDAAKDGLKQETLISGTSTGQLARRFENIARWLQNDLPTDPETVAIWNEYVPNVWGPVYQKKSGYPAFLFLWGFIALAAAALWAWWLGSSTQMESHLKRRPAPERRGSTRPRNKRTR